MERTGRLARSMTDRVFAGVCGGIGAYIGLNPLWVRLLFIIMAPTTGGYGVLLYILLWIVLPQETLDALPALEPVRPGDPPNPAPPRAARGSSMGQVIFAIAAMLLGVALLVLLSDVLPVPAGDLFWPVAALSIGLALLWRQARGV